MKEKILKRVDQCRDKLLRLADDIRENPETAMNEHKAANGICELLESEGFFIERGLGGMDTAFRAKKTTGAGPRIAIMAEYDALPELGHACGHHLISAMSVGAGIALATALNEYPGEVAIIGTPGEELGEGKPRLIECGALEGYDAAMMIHPYAKTVVCPSSLCLSGIEFRFIGKAAHAGLSPYEGVNALDAVVLLYTGINAMRQQLKDGARVHGIILEAGSAVNIIPDKSRARFELRSNDPEYFKTVYDKVINCAKAAALATGCTLEYEKYEPDCMCLTHNEALVEAFRKSMAYLGVEENGEGMVSTDMGNVSAVIPSIHPMLQMVDNGAQLHTDEFLEGTRTAFAQERIIMGAKLLALTGLEVLCGLKL